MQTLIKEFKELTTDELFEIYKLRVSVFVVEQNCPYQEVDDEDKRASHVFMKDGDKIIAYLRIIPDANDEKVVHLGRVISVKRRCGIGTQLVSEGIRISGEKYNAESIRLEAQVYAADLYEKLGFKKCSPEYELDGIPHVEMKYNIKNEIIMGI